MRRASIGAVVLLALFAAGTGAAQPAKPSPSPAPKSTATAATSAAPKPPSTPATSASPKPTSTPAASAATTSAPAATTTATASGTAAPAVSSAPVTPAPDDAGTLFQKGREAFKADQFDAALELFQKSYAMEATPGTLLNIALAEDKLGRTASALRDFERVVGQLKPDDDRLPIARDGMTRASARAPRLKIARAAGAPPTMAIQLDGAPLDGALVGQEQPLDPGKHTITTSVFGYEDRTYEIVLTEGQHLATAVEPGKRTLVAGPLVTASPTGTASPSNPARAASFAIAGAGLAGLGVGIATGILALGKKGDLEAACPTPSACSGAGLRALGEAHTLADVSTGTLIFGGAALVGGAALLFLAGDGKSLFVSASPTMGGAASGLRSPAWAGAALSATGRF